MSVWLFSVPPAGSLLSVPPPDLRICVTLSLSPSVFFARFFRNARPPFKTQRFPSVQISDNKDQRSKIKAAVVGVSIYVARVLPVTDILLVSVQLTAM